MSQESSNYPISLAGNSFYKDPTQLIKAVEHVAEHEEQWCTDPTAIEVTQPVDQAQFCQAFGEMLESQEEKGGILKNLFELNIAQIRMQYERTSGVTTLQIDCVPDQGSRRKTTRTAELIADPFQPNVMKDGLIAVTGSKILRDDMADGSQSGNRIYKGMFEGSPIYFWEKLNAISQSGETMFRRCLYAATEQWIIAAFKTLSERDIEIMRLLDIDISAAHDSIPRMDRLRMIEVISLYAAFNATLPMEQDKS